MSDFCDRLRGGPGPHGLDADAGPARLPASTTAQSSAGSWARPCRTVTASWGSHTCTAAHWAGSMGMIRHTILPYIGNR